MPNPGGKNGYGKKNYPPDEELKMALHRYAAHQLTQADKLERLKADFQLGIKTTKLNKLERKFGVPSVRKPPPDEVSKQAILDEVERDTSQNNGPNFVKSKLKDKGMMIPRRTVRKVMHEHHPEGFNVRFPGNKKSKISRVSLSAIGPFHEVSADGHEKLSMQALQMGQISLPIYAYKDKWTDDLLKIDVVPDCRTAKAVGHLFLDFVEENGCIPLQLTTDKGSEIGWEYAFQVAFRAVFAPNVDPNIYPEFAAIKSVHNTIIEGFWRWLRLKWGINIKEHILRGKTEHIFVPTVEFHKHLFHWLFPPLVQAELDEFKLWWNQHRVRHQNDKNMPSGHVPADALANPQLFCGLDCRVPIPNDAVQAMRDYLTEEVGSREECLRWVPEEFDMVAKEVHATLGKPRITLDNAWTVFRQMSDVIEQHRLY